MARPINIQGAPSQFRPYLKAADKQGDKNGFINTDEEAQSAVAACEALKSEGCENIKIFIEHHQFQLIHKPNYIELKVRLDKIRLIDNEVDKADEIIDLSEEIAKAPLTKNNKHFLFAYILEISRSIKGPFNFKVNQSLYDPNLYPHSPCPDFCHKLPKPNFPLPAIAYSMKKADLNNIKIIKVVYKAVSVIRKIKDTKLKVEALKDLANKMAEVKLDKHVIHYILKEALIALRSIKDVEDKINELCDIAEIIISSGLDKKLALRILREALSVARKIEDPDITSSFLKDIATFLARAGFHKEALSVVKNANLDEDEIKDLFRKAEVKFPK